MGIRDDLARTHGGFIGLRELLEALAQFECVDFREAAAWLSRKLLEAKAKQERAPDWCTYSPAAGVLRATAGSVKRACELLEMGASLGRSGMQAADDAGEADTLGFSVIDVELFLSWNCVALDLQPSGNLLNATQDREDWPDWRRALAAQELLTLDEAASALAGIDPHAWGNRSGDEHAELARWETALRRSATVGTLPLVDYQDEHGNDMRGIRPADFAAWCASRPGGLAYPLPALQALPAADPALREALQQEAPTRAAVELKRIAPETDLAALERERDAALQEQEAQRQRADALADKLQQAWRERDALAAKLANARQDAEAAMASEWARQLADLDDLKARYLHELQRLAHAAVEHEALRTQLEREGGAALRQQRELTELRAAMLSHFGKEREGQLGAPESATPNGHERGDLVRPVPALLAQEQAILQTLVSMGHDPLRLPERQPGRPGVKAAARKALGKAGTWGRPTVFEKAWKRLRAEGRIAGGG